MTDLTKPVSRVVTLDGHRHQVTLEGYHPDGPVMIHFRRLRRSHVLTVPIERVYLLAAKLAAEQLLVRQQLLKERSTRRRAR